MDPALLFAVFRRLSGYPLDDKGNPRLNTDGTPMNYEGKFGMRIPMSKPGASNAGLSTRTPEAYRLWARGFHPTGYKQVPVYIEGIDARKWDDVFPACSFTVSDIVPGSDPYTYDPGDGEDGIGTDIGSAIITNPATGYQFTVPDHRTTRKNPEPWDVMITISLYAKDLMQMAMLERVLLALFPGKGAIEVEQLDGTYRSLDMFMERYSVMDQGEPYDPQAGTGADRAAFMKRAFTWRVETSLDNSAVGFGTDDFTTQYMILERLLELTDMQSRLLETISLEILTP